MTGGDGAEISGAVDASFDPRPRRRGFWPVALLVLVAFVAGAGGAWWAVRSRQPVVAAQPVVAPAVVVRPVIEAPAPASAGDASVDPATLAVREGVLAGQLAALEARTASTAADALAAGGQAGRAEALLVVAAVRRAIDAGQPLGYLEGQLRARFAVANPRAVDVAVDAGRRPVTLDDLRLGLASIGPALATGAGQGWWSSLRREVGSLVVLRQAGTPSPLPADRLARAERLVDGGQVETARVEVARLPGAGAAAGWLDAAHRYALARRALDALEGAALAGRAAPAR